MQGRSLSYNKAFKRASSNDEVGHVQVFGSIFTEYHLYVALNASRLGFFKSNHVFYVEKSGYSNGPENEEQK